MNPVRIGKKYLLLIALEMLVLSGFPVPAQIKTEKGALEAVIYPAPENPFVVFVRLDNPRRRLVSVSVWSGKKEKLFAEWTSRYKYNVKLNLSELPNGEYRVEVTDRRKVIKKTVHISTLYQQRTQRIVSLSDPASN